MNKAYNPINWVNNETPINETNLNKMSNGLSAVDDRVIALNKTLGSYSDKINEALEASVVAQDAKEIALESAEKAEEALKNAEAVVGVGIATKDKAGLVKADDVHIASDGTLKFIEKTTSTTMPNSHKGRLMFEEIGGVSEQGSTTGAQLLNFDTAVNFTATKDFKDVVVNNPFTQAGTYYFDCTDDIGTVGYKIWAYDSSKNLIINAYRGQIEVTDKIISQIVTVRLVFVGLVIGTTYKGKVYPTVCYDTEALPYEPYTGAQPSPNPSYPQEIRTVKGKNLMDCRGLTEQTINGVTFTPVYDDNGNLLYVNVNGTATANANYGLSLDFNLPKESYILSGCPSGGANASSYKMYLNHSTNGAVYVDVGNGKTFTNDYDKLSAVIVVYSGYTATALRFYPMIRPASVADATYAPYGLLRIKTHGKNLFNANLQNTESNGVTCTDNGDGTYTLNGTTTTGTYSRFNLGSIYLNGTYKFVGCPDGGNTGGNKFGLNLLENNTFGGARYAVQNKAGMQVTENRLFGVCIIVEAGYTCNNLVFQPMITKDLEATYDEFEPYTESSITLSSPIELCGIGDVQDVIDVENGVVRRRFTEIVLDGSETWRIDTSSGRFYTEDFKSILSATTTSTQTANALCTHYEIKTATETYHKNRGFSIDGSAWLQICDSDFADKTAFVAWLAENQPKLICELATEEVTDLPTADKIALNSLATYDGATYLEWDCYLEPTFKGKYGTSEVGGYSLEGLLAGRNGEMVAISNADRITALETALINNV